MKKYVLVSQGILIFETYDKTEAEQIMNINNDEWVIHKQKCLDNKEPYADNEVLMYEEEL